MYNIMVGETIMIPTFETGSMLLTFVTMGKMLESRAKANTLSIMQSLMSLQPSEAVVVTFPNPNPSSPPSADPSYDTYSSKTVDQSSLKKGDVVLLSPHTTAPCDGTVLHAKPHIFIDESYITGESFPVKKTKNSSVIGGTKITSGTAFMVATSVGSETVLNKIVELVQQAQETQAPIQLFADRITAVFTPAVLSISAVTFLTWIVCSGSFLMAFMR